MTLTPFLLDAISISTRRKATGPSLRAVRRAALFASNAQEKPAPGAGLGSAPETHPRRGRPEQRCHACARSRSRILCSKRAVKHRLDGPPSAFTRQYCLASFISDENPTPNRRAASMPSVSSRREIGSWQPKLRGPARHVAMPGQGRLC